MKRTIVRVFFKMRICVCPNRITYTTCVTEQLNNNVLQRATEKLLVILIELILTKMLYCQYIKCVMYIYKIKIYFVFCGITKSNINNT